MIDPLDIQLARHLDEIDASDAKNEWIDQRAKELLQGDYSPKNCDNMIEAIGNTAHANKQTLVDRVNQCRAIGITALIRDISYDYWAGKAEQRAEQEWQRR
jgi:hypothetical protein